MPDLHIEVASAPIPFRTSFKHAAAERATAENVLVRVEDGQGQTGLGEGCPRAYVSGESVDGALAFIATHHAAFSAMEDLDTLRAWTHAHGPLIDAHPSAFCAVELALLDLFARRRGCSVETLLGIASPERALRTSAIYSDGGAAKFWAQYLAYGAAGLNEAKLKIGGDIKRDLSRAHLLAARGRLRLDANNCWEDAAPAGAALAPFAAYAWAVEEPIRAKDWDGLRRVSQTTGLCIILDESFLTPADLERAPTDIPILPNFRVSKLGGLLRALACLARWPGDVIVGAHVGETSILGRAGFALAQAAGDRLVGFEGGYARVLLTKDVVKPSLGFGFGGSLRCAASPGFGLEPAHPRHGARNSAG